MKRAAWLGCFVVVAALGSAGCAFQVAGQGQDEPVDGTSQSLGPSHSAAGFSNGTDPAGSNDGTFTTTTSQPGKPTPDPWGIVSPAKPTPDPWRPGQVGSGSASGDNGSQSGSDPNSTSTTQSGAGQANTR